MASVSALGCGAAQVWSSYKAGQSHLKERDFGKFSAVVSSIDGKLWTEVNALRRDKKYRDLDPSVLLAIYVSRKAYLQTNWSDVDFGINIGSSRGATHLLEKYFEEFSKSDSGRVSTLSSPTTTLGNISSWVAHDLQTQGPTISHSIACSTALHGVLNGIAWINSGMSERFLAGGSEVSNTPFTVAQMKALKIYTSSTGSYPCRSLDADKQYNSMALGEAAGVFCLERGTRKGALALIEGIGYATEPLKHGISISTDALCFQRSMEMALEGCSPVEVDVIVTHAPGTIKGDSSELLAIEKVYGSSGPALTSNKWLIGHTLGASGAMSLEMAILMLQHQELISPPYLELNHSPESIRKVMVNAVGFGGNAVSILLSLDK